MARRIKRNDIVQVMAGDDRGRRGRVLAVLDGGTRVLVEGINFVVKHQRRSEKYPKGGRIKREAPVAASNVQVVCPKCDKPARVRIRRDEEGRPVRVCHRCGQGVATEG
jgi:large subunit ribosomal protein L24